jgi:hypothetical protein
MSKKNQFLLFFGAVILATIFTPMFGGLYEKILGPAAGGFFWTSSSAAFEGFIFSFLFFGSLLSWVFAENKKKYWLSYTLPFLIFMLLLGAFEELIIGIGLVLIGWLLAQGVLWVKGRMKK